MPLQTACSACSAKIKVKDELVGKSIKCPKCGNVFKALAGAEPANAVKVAAASSNGAVASKPLAQKPPTPAWGADDEDETDDEKKPAWDRKSKAGDEDDDEDAEAKKKPIKKGPPPKKRAANDDEEEEDEDEEIDENQAFEELLEQTTLSPIAKKQITGELGLREKGLWIGQPDPKIMTVRGIPKALVGIFVCIILAIFGSVASGTLIQNNPGLTAILIGGIIVLTFILAIIIFGLVLFMERKKAIGAAYVITNKRCITFLPGWFVGPRPTSYYPDLVQHMRRMPSWIFGGDAGDIVFRSVTTVTTTYHRHGGASTSVSTTYYGFLGIRNLDDIEERIRQALFADDEDEEEEDRRKKKKKAKKKKTIDQVKGKK